MPVNFSRLVIQNLPLAKASIELVGNSDGTLLGCLSEVEEQFRPGEDADVCVNYVEHRSD